MPQPVKNAVKTVKNAVNKYVVQPVKSFISNPKQAVSNAKQTVQTFVSNTKAKAAQKWNDFTTSASNKWNSIKSDVSAKVQKAIDDTMHFVCTTKDTIKTQVSEKLTAFRDNVKSKTGIDVYALGNAALALAGAVGSAAAMCAGILAAPETGGASLALTAFAFGSLAFSCSDLVQYFNDIYVGKDGDYRYGTEI